MQTPDMTEPATLVPRPRHNFRIETVIPKADGTWYGYYLRGAGCGRVRRLTRTLPRIGAARSTDRGATWEDLGADPQEGIYVSFSPRLDGIQRWSPPQRIMVGGGWYPHVMGMKVASGTDRLAGRTARFFTVARSEHLIRFHR